MLGRDWEPAKATIVERKKMILGTDHGSGNPPRYKFVVDVEVPGKQPFRTTMKSPVWTTDQSSLWGNKFIPPHPGQVVPVKADPERRKAKWDRSKEANAAVLQDLLARRQAAAATPQPGDQAGQLERIIAAGVEMPATLRSFAIGEPHPQIGGTSVKLDLTVEPPAGSPYDVSIEQVLPPTITPTLAAGQRVTVKAAADGVMLWNTPHAAGGADPDTGRPTGAPPPAG